MPVTNIPEVNAIIDQIVTRLQQILRSDFVALHLYGSVVTGGYHPTASDIDLLAVTAHELDEPTFAALEAMHHAIVADNPAWNNRIEIIYLSAASLQKVKTPPFTIAKISPGEAFHRIETNIEWLMNWYTVQELGISLYGPPPRDLIAHISADEFRASVREHLPHWREYIKDVEYRGTQAYAILTMCRGLYTLKHGAQTSKDEAAEWAQHELPEWAELIRNAVTWRKVQNEAVNVDHAATLPETRRFVAYVIERVAALA
jgi:hypothetical protein